MNDYGIWFIDRDHMIRYLPLTRRQGWRRRIIAAIRRLLAVWKFDQ